MTPFISNLIKRGCITVNSHDNIAVAVHSLVKHSIGAVVVTDTKNYVCGIVSERDIIKHLSINVEIEETAIEKVMTAEVITVEKDVTSAELMDLMTQNRIRHIPITNEGKLTGIVSIGDVVKRLLEKHENESELMKQFINS